MRPTGPRLQLVTCHSSLFCHLFFSLSPPNSACLNPADFGGRRMDADVERLLAGWFERARDKQLTHDECGTRLHRWHYRFGIPIIILEIGRAAAIFYSLG